MCSTSDLIESLIKDKPEYSLLDNFKLSGTLFKMDGWTVNTHRGPWCNWKFYTAYIPHDVLDHEHREASEDEIRKCFERTPDLLAYRAEDESATVITETKEGVIFTGDRSWDGNPELIKKLKELRPGKDLVINGQPVFPRP